MLFSSSFVHAKPVYTNLLQSKRDRPPWALSGNDRSVPIYFYFGDRQAQVLHCRLCLNISDLTRNLVARHLAQDASCTCGATSGTVRHYLLYCPNHNIRDTTIHSTPWKSQFRYFNGTTSLQVSVNKNIYISDSTWLYCQLPPLRREIEHPPQPRPSLCLSVCLSLPPSPSPSLSFIWNIQVLCIFFVFFSSSSM